jgi:hypothetical protein
LVRIGQSSSVQLNSEHNDAKVGAGEGVIVVEGVGVGAEVVTGNEAGVGSKLAKGTGEGVGLAVGKGLGEEVGSWVGEQEYSSAQHDTHTVLSAAWHSNALLPAFFPLATA